MLANWTMGYKGIFSYHVFISYSTRDLTVVESVADVLSKIPGVEYFLAKYSLQPGTPQTPAIMNAIKACDMYLLIWSDASQSSEWVLQELGAAQASGKTIVPVMLQDRENARLPDSIRDLNWLSAYPDVDPAEWLDKLQRRVMQSATQQQLNDIAALTILAALVGWLASGPDEAKS